MRKSRGYWTKEHCQEEALKYKTRNEFKNNSSAYEISLRNNWLNDVCSHLRGYKSKGYWTKEHCQEESLKYNTRLDFQLGSRWPYRIALKNDWMNDICSHMKVIGNIFNRCIYVYEFSNNHAYIGLTFNVDNRNKRHLEKGTVYKHIKINPVFELKQLTKYINIEEAKKLENKFVKEYKKNGWTILNKIKTGGIGGKKFWTKEKCEKVASKYKTTAEFNKTSAAISARRYGWLEKINNNLELSQKHSGYWTKEKCQEESLKYNTRIDFFKNSSGVYSTCVRKKWLDDVCTHMKEKKEKKNIEYYTKENCSEKSIKYNSKVEFKNNDVNYYYASIKNKWLDEICSHMTGGKKPDGYWNKDHCKEEALKYKNKTQFRKNCSSAYNSAKKNKWLKEFF